MPYTIPDTLLFEIDELESSIREFEAGRLDGGILKARRVPFGIYEQRTPGTFMVRVRCTGGTLAPEQLASLADLADRDGSPFLHLTSRQDVQIHDLPIGRIPSLLRDLAARGLSSRGGGGNTVRNILASPEAGHDPDEPFDVGPWVDALTDRLIREKDSWNLPRKFKISFASSDRDTALAGFNDLGFYPAEGPSSVPGFEVWVAGGLGGKPRTALKLFDWIPASEVHLVATAIKKFFDRNGNRRNKRQARLRFLRDRFGDDGLLAKLREAVEEERGSGFLPLEPSIRPAAPGPSPVPAQEPAKGFEAWKAGNVEIHPSTGTAKVRIPVLLGDLSTESARGLGRLLAGRGAGVLRLSPKQDLLLVGISAADLAGLHSGLSALGLASVAGGPEDLVACTGADTCKLGMCYPKGAVRELARRLSVAGTADAPFSGVRVHVSGCPNSCAQHMLADLGFYGAARRQGQRMFPAYRVVAGGRLGRGSSRLAREVGQVAAKNLPDFVMLAVERFRAWGQGTFPEWVDQGGEAVLKELAAPLAGVADWEADPSGFFDWGADKPFSPTNGGAECSAGLFDLIEIDREAIRAARGRLQGEGVTESVANALAFHSCRMLLVARGIEPTTPSGVFDGFILGFLETGLVEPRFRPLVESARASGALAGRIPELLELADRVEALYLSMDDSLRFSA